MTHMTMYRIGWAAYNSTMKQTKTNWQRERANVIERLRNRLLDDHTRETLQQRLHYIDQEHGYEARTASSKAKKNNQA